MLDQYSAMLAQYRAMLDHYRDMVDRYSAMLDHDSAMLDHDSSRLDHYSAMLDHQYRAMQGRASQEYFKYKSILRLHLSCLPLGLIKWYALKKIYFLEFEVTCFAF